MRFLFSLSSVSFRCLSVSCHTGRRKGGGRKGGEEEERGERKGEVRREEGSIHFLACGPL